MPAPYLKAYFNFSKKERNGIFILLTLILLLLIIPFFFPLFISPKKYDHRQFEKEIAALSLAQVDSSAKFSRQGIEEENSTADYERAIKQYNDHSRNSLFDFDPNTLSTEDWRQLGLKDKTIQTIQNYLSKGGKFKKPQDINKIWGLHEAEVQRLLPYVKIKESNDNEKKNTPRNTNEFAVNRPYNAINKKIVVDVNTADTTTFIALPGIGSKLAGRIVAFRDKLGGFYKIEQVAETFGLPDSTYQKIKTRLVVGEPTVKQLNINIATVEEMRSHPYLRYAIANAIIQYRTQHGNFTTITELKKIMLVTEDVYNKIAPYLGVE